MKKKDKVFLKNFLEAVRYEYGFFDTEIYLSNAFNMYKKYADLTDYYCMYKMHIIYLCEYLPDGLTNSTWTLLANNPMGYAMMFNTKLKYKSTFKEKINITLQFISCCCLAKEYQYIKNCHLKTWALLLFPAGLLLSCRRKKQIHKNT